MVTRKSIFSLLLLTLIIFKVSSATIHIHSEHGQDEEHEEHCELCEHAIYNQLLEFFTPAEFLIDQEGYEANYYQPTNDYKSVAISAFFDATLFSRPPPHTI